MTYDPTQYTMSISWTTVDKLGVKLYDKINSVLAEIISNSYDADATEVNIYAPMNKYLAKKENGKVVHSDYQIIIDDNGFGMSPEQLQEFYLVVGGERRKDRRRVERPSKYNRKPMGRKGIGKLAPFGVCQKIEIISAGGEITSQGFQISHIILDRNEITQASDKEYHPRIGDKDKTYAKETFTKVILSEFEFKRVPDIETLARQLSQRFGINSPDWKIYLHDTTSDDATPYLVDAFTVTTMPGTRLKFSGPEPTVACDNLDDYIVKKENGDIPTDIQAGFQHEGKYYPVVGWAGYSQVPYKDELMAGIRIYCRGKFAAQTTLFNRAAGFTGEHSVRAYLVGELHLDWLDEDEDLIQTARRDILWSHELGEALQEWGQNLVKYIGKMSRAPMREDARKQFFELAHVEDQIQNSYPGDNQKSLRQSAKHVAEALGRTMRKEEIEDEDARQSIVNLAIMLAPLQDLNDQIREVGNDESTPIKAINKMLQTANIAEYVTFGEKIRRHLKILSILEDKKDDESTEEADLQKLIEDAPWLLNPQWIPITSNSRLSTFKKEFEKFYKESTKKDIILVSFTEERKRPDFICFNQDGILQIIEIKKPKHKVRTEEMKRIMIYYNEFKKFFSAKEQPAIKDFVHDFKITLVADGLELDIEGDAYLNVLQNEGRFAHTNWRDFFLRARAVHQEFLDEAERLKCQRP